MEDERSLMSRIESGLTELNALGGFDRAGLHSQSWANIRAAGHVYELEDECGWPGCRSTDLRRSHTIAKSSGLLPLTQDGHVLMPNFNQRPVQMSLMGWKIATTFPGYCGAHEQKFQVFESRGSLETLSDYALQLFRSAAREYWNKRRWRAYLEKLQAEYSEVLIDNPIEPISPGLADRVLRPLEDLMRRTRDEGTFIVALWEACWKLSELGENAEADPSAKLVRSVHIPTSRRIALSGSTFVDVWNEHSNSMIRVPVVLAMLPTATGVHCIFVSAMAITDQYEDELHAAIRNDDGNAFIDSWMTATEWWCADPEWWESTDASWRDSIVSRLEAI